MKVEILIGNIASGKSTYSEQRAKERALIINDDAIVSELHAGFYELYSKDYKQIYKTIETNILTCCIMCNVDCVIDRGLNVSRNSRRRFVSICNSCEIPCDAIVFEFYEPSTHAKRRIEHDSRGYDFEYWKKVAEHKQLVYEIPLLEEGFREIKYIK